MSDLDSEIQREAFPILTDEQIALLRPFGEVRPTQAGDVLFEVGDATYPLVVVLSGETAIIDRSDGSGLEKMVSMWVASVSTGQIQD